MISVTVGRNTFLATNSSVVLRVPQLSLTTTKLRTLNYDSIVKTTLFTQSFGQAHKFCHVEIKKTRIQKENST